MHPDKNQYHTKSKKETRGHMALRNNVYDLKLELWHILKPLEMHLVDIIIDKTIKWRTDEASLKIEELMERTRQKHTHIYTALKKLEALGVINRRKVGHHLIVGLSREYFGGLLIKKHEDALQAKRGKLKVVVDNSKSLSKTRTRSVPKSDKVGTESVQPLCRFGTEKVHQDFETIGENRSLNTLLKDISIKTSLKESKKPEESFTLFRDTEEENRKRKAEHRQRVMDQVALALSGGVL